MPKQSRPHCGGTTCRPPFVSVVVVGDDQIASLNERHLQHIGPTDVITFDLSDDEGISADEAASRAVEGEIIVSWDTAAREASTRGHTTEAELALYVVHGTLHLLGYDDHEPSDAATMHAMEDEILIGLGCGPVFGADKR